jgi:hypothetical protein
MTIYNIPLKINFDFPGLQFLGGIQQNCCKNGQRRCLKVEKRKVIQSSDPALLLFPGIAGTNNKMCAGNDQEPGMVA